MESQFAQIDESHGWHKLFVQIRTEAAEITAVYSIAEAKREENRSKNRYRDVSPFDDTRVKLKSGQTDYINANLVKTPALRRYILAQGPLPNTCGHFWQMVWEQHTKAIIMLNRVIEKGSVKCAQYWPLNLQAGQNSLEFADTGFQVTLLSENVGPSYTTRVLELEETRALAVIGQFRPSPALLSVNPADVCLPFFRCLVVGAQTGQTKEVLHFHYTQWPDFGVPESPAAFLDFLQKVRESGSLENDVGPSVIHCSAGIGRSGTLILTDTCLVLIEKGRKLNLPDLKEILLGIRKYRMGLIQTPEQLRFSYLAVIKGAAIMKKNGSLLAISNELDEEGLLLPDSPPPLPPKRIKPDMDQSPPIPPPRTVSVTAPVAAAASTASTAAASTAAASTAAASTAAASTVAAAAASPPEATQTQPISTVDSRESELRKRKRQEKQQELSNKVREMQNKQRNTEVSNKRKKTLKMVGMVAGVSIALLVGVYIVYSRWG